MILRYLLIIIALTPAFGLAKTTPEIQFWSWFQQNESILFNFEKDQESVFDSLSKEMKKVNPDLTFEFGPILKNGKREFVISAGGIKKAFPKVESLFKVAPKSSKFIFIKFRPRRVPMQISLGGKEVKPENISCKLYKDDDKLGIIMFFEDYKDSERDIWGSIGFLMIDQALGEYDVETKVGFIEFKSKKSKYFAGAFALPELSTRFDNYFKNRP